MKDARGYEYQELLDMQENHMRRWAEKLNPAMWAEIVPYLLSTNREATAPDEKHRVYRGQDLVQIIQDWPNPGFAYEPRVPPAEEEDVL